MSHEMRFANIQCAYTIESGKKYIICVDVDVAIIILRRDSQQIVQEDN